MTATGGVFPGGRMTRVQKRREGFALAAAVLAMLIVGAIVTGGFYAASQENDIGQGDRFADEAFYLAEQGLHEVVGGWTAAQFNTIALNTEASQAAVSVNDEHGTQRGTYQTHVAHLASRLFYIRSTGTVTRGGRFAGATREVGVVVRLHTATFPRDRALQVYGDLSVGGTSEIDGTDDHPSDWTGCDDPVSTSAAVVTNPGTTVDESGSGEINGSVVRTTLTADDFLKYGDLSYDQLAALADKVYDISDGPDPDPVSSGGVCTTAVKSNWGQPTIPSDPCFDYFPIIWAKDPTATASSPGTGTFHISSNGVGQGVLLVDGDLQLDGGFQFYGVVLVKGTFRTEGQGGHVNGVLLSYGGGDIGSTSTAVGKSTVQFNSCAIDRAVYGNIQLSRSVPIADRSWIDLSAVRAAG